MLKFNAPSFMAAIANLQSGRYRIEGHLRADHDRTLEKAIVSDGDRKSAPKSLKVLKIHILNIGCRVTAMAVDDFITALDADAETKTMTIKLFAEKIAEDKSRLRHELSLSQLYVLDNERAKYFTAGPSAFGSDVSDALPQAIPDIEDAGKCIALQQGTASVFHSMRVMEAALKELARLLGIPYAPSWESYITQIEAQINAKHKRKTIKWKRDKFTFGRF